MYGSCTTVVVSADDGLLFGTAGRGCELSWTTRFFSYAPPSPRDRVSRARFVRSDVSTVPRTPCPPPLLPPGLCGVSPTDSPPGRVVRGLPPAGRNSSTTQCHGTAREYSSSLTAAARRLGCILCGEKKEKRNTINNTPKRPQRSLSIRSDKRVKANTANETTQSRAQRHHGRTGKTAAVPDLVYIF